MSHLWFIIVHAADSSAAYVFEIYMEMLSFSDQEDNVYLFPCIEDDGTIFWDTWADDQSFMDWWHTHAH